MKDNSIKDIFDEAYKRELSGSDNSPEHKFSFNHKRKMKKIFRLFDKNTETQPDTAAHKSAKRLTVAVVLIIVLLALSAVVSVAISIYTGFSKKMYNNHNDFFVINNENGLETIEYVYEFTNLPENYTIDSRRVNLIHCWTEIKNLDTGKTISVRQTVKKEYTGHYDNEYSECDTVYIGDIPAVYMDSSDETGNFGTLLWDNGDYVMEITGHLNKSELINLAKLLKISKNENLSSQNLESGRSLY